MTGRVPDDRDADAPVGGSVSGEASTDDPFGLRSLDLTELARRPGAKWHRPAGRMAAWVADMDFPVAPAIRHRLVELATTDVGYPDWDHPTHSPLPQLFASRMLERYRWEPRLDRLHELSDVVQGVRLALHHLTDPGDAVVLHTPAYAPFLRTIEEMGRRIVRVPWPFDHDRLDAELVGSGARMLLLCHPHNPTGHVFGRAELARIVEIAARHDLEVVSDEIHADLTYAPNVHVPFESVAIEVSPAVAARSVTVTSSSKAFNTAGLRWAVLHASSDRLHRVLSDLGDHYFGAPNVMAVAAAEAAWTQGGDWLRAVREVLDENRHALTGLLADHLPGAIYRVPDATYLAWIDCRPLGFDPDPATVFARRGVEVSPGPSFGVEGEGHVRLNLATSPAVLERIVTAMAG